MDRITFEINGVRYQVFTKPEDTQKFMELIVPLCDKEKVTNNTVFSNN